MFGSPWYKHIICNQARSNCARNRNLINEAETSQPDQAAITTNNIPEFMMVWHTAHANPCSIETLCTAAYIIIYVIKVYNQDPGYQEQLLCHSLLNFVNRIL